ncbi:hypothetical protein QBC46DRAFT_416957 [Diplogelasinospora grovesii]|uniref:DNA polymerase n=1 Tax=Diplogelasinospora grovesii TaxID=303347 RepID=A0AAN6NH40_9PEZI|nr:hypothetical protein QBC46DRAFT_416957 [Diplogelasinospora grovesii]
MDVFRVRLNCIDHYQATPTRYDPRLRNDIAVLQVSKEFARESKVPVIRVFGSTETGQKVCAHIHGAFPYLYIEYHGSLDQEQVGKYMLRLHLDIDHALAVSYRKDDPRDRPKYVARITLVKGVPFYGFHVGYRFYLKIYMLNPAVMSRLADLLQQGAIMGRALQPYEAHLQYLLQFMTDYNLYGCGFIEAIKTTFRAPVPLRDEYGQDSAHTWHHESIPADIITNDEGLPRVSHCCLEVDICVQDILNRSAIKERRLHHDFIERLQPPLPETKLVHSMADLWRDETKRRKRRMGNMDPKSSPFPPEDLVSMSADPRNAPPSNWLHEEEYRREIRVLVEQEAAGRADGKQPTFSDYVETIPLADTVKTVAESVEDLFPENLVPALGLNDLVLEADEERDPGLSASPDPEGAADTVDLDPSLLHDELVQIAELVERATAWIANSGSSSAGEYSPEFNGGEDGEQQILDADDVEVTLTVGGPLVGIGVSGFRAGKRPPTSLRKEMAAEAEAVGLGSKDRDESWHPMAEPALGKRARWLSFASSRDVPGAKRRKMERLGQPGTAVTEVTGPTTSHSGSMGTQRDAEVCGSSPSKSQQSSRLRTVTGKWPSVKSKGNKTLSFAIVKNPHDPSTRSRLGQQSGDVATRKDEFFKKHQSSRQAPLPSTDPSPLHRPSPPSLPLSNLPLPASRSPPSLKPNAVRMSWGTAPTATFVFPGPPPPSPAEACSTMRCYGLPDVIYQVPFYSNEEDVPARNVEYAGREFYLAGNSLPYLPAFDATGQSPASSGSRDEDPPDLAEMGYDCAIQQQQCTIRTWELAEPPPSFEEVRQWGLGQQQPDRHAGRGSGGQPRPCRPDSATQKDAKRDMSQIVGQTPKNTHGFKYSQKTKSTSVRHEAQYMSTMSLEIHVNTRGTLVPNPEHDEVQCIFWCLVSDGSSLDTSQQRRGGDPLQAGIQAGILVLSEDGLLAQRIRSQTPVAVTEETSELDLMNTMVDMVRTHDPDILTGYEVHGSSWGYLIERARVRYDYNLCDEFSRVKSDSHGRSGKEADRWGFNTTSTIRVTGRHVINIWRAMRGELNLLQYTLENVAWHLLHRRVPHYSWRTLTDWYASGRPGDLAKLVRYYLARTRLDLEVLDKNELIPRTSEQARLLGVDFFSVFSRGSQYKVESIMFRIAKPENLLLISPSRRQVGGQNALECLPLVMEPQSAFYESPLVVMDFQSLYPSVMIAYNYCYSTFLGRIANWRGTNKMGFAEYQRQQGLLRLLQDHINIAPNGMMYAKAGIRKSLLAKMLAEILETRVMVKGGMKQDKDDRALQQLLHNRQLALKLLANVTYGYTSASFSGRMPCSEIADSIVQTGRETLERAIAYIHSVERWGAEVVYGDTDSLFVYLRGRTREQAFAIGAEMAKAITDRNPRPVKLKFEKVYHPCVLLAKKRYVGYKYESAKQVVPDFDAKGIETVRRDGTPAEQMIEEKALRLLFETADLSRVKAYFGAQCDKIMRGAVSVRDFCFAKEVRLGTYSTNSAAPPPPGALISTRGMIEDARAEPQYGERVPYVVVTGPPGTRLVDRCIPPEDLVHNPHLALDADYYMTKNIIPPLERIFNLVGVSVSAWYDEMPKTRQVRRLDASEDPPPPPPAGDAKPHSARVLEWFMHSSTCIVCGYKLKRMADDTSAAADSAGEPPAGGPPAEESYTDETSSDETSGDDEPLICRSCLEDAATSVAKLHSHFNNEERKYAKVMKVCQSCAGHAPLEEVPCDSRDCPVFYTRVKQEARLQAEWAAAEPVMEQLAQPLDW